MRNHASERNVQDSDDRKGLSDPCPQAEPFSFGACFLKIIVKTAPRANAFTVDSVLSGAYSRVYCLAAGRISAENIKTIQTKIGDEN